MKITLEQGQKLWLTSDTHYHHANICSATTKWTNPVTLREFKTLEHMDAMLVGNINEVVGQNDILFHLGDWSFGGFEKIREFREKIVCQNVHIITGNHDQHIESNRENVQSLFSSVNKYLELSVRKNDIKQTFVLMHFPIASWNDLAKGAIHLHGHVHLPSNKRVGPGKMMDVGVDGNDLKPISVGEILTLMERQPVKGMLTFDHHEIVENYK